METIRLYLIALRNFFFGFSIISFKIFSNPRKLINVISVQLFYFKTLTGKGRLEQKNPDEILPSLKKYDIKIDTDCYFWKEDPSYVKDIVMLQGKRYS